MNGRVSFADGQSVAPFTMFGGGEQGSRSQPPNERMIHQKQSPVSQLYFSQRNVDALQEGIRYRVYVETNGSLVIGRQSEVELGLVMRSVFLQDCMNGEDDIVPQVRALNTTVLAYCVPRVLQEAKMNARYQRDVSTLPVPLARGVSDTTKGDRSLAMKRDLW